MTELEKAELEEVAKFMAVQTATPGEDLRKARLEFKEASARCRALMLAEKQAKDKAKLP